MGSCKIWTNCSKTLTLIYYQQRLLLYILSMNCGTSQLYPPQIIVHMINELWYQSTIPPSDYCTYDQLWYQSIIPPQIMTLWYQSIIPPSDYCTYDQ